MEIKIPNLTLNPSLRFCKTINSIDFLNEEKLIFDFGNIKTCDPFPMLIVSNAIRHKHEELFDKQFFARNIHNSYAGTMKFYNACGIGIGEPVDISKGNSNYNSITKLSVEQLRKEGASTFCVIQEIIDEKAKDMAEIVAQGNINFQKWLTFLIRELIRNIPEHSKSDAIWYCAQYWPSYDLVELAIMDEGIGIRNSLCNNENYASLISCDKDAIELSLEPGVSESLSFNDFSQDVWKNSGYGLFVVSQMCAELDASFVVASGESAIEVKKRNGTVINKIIDTDIKGTAFQIRVRLSEMFDYEKIRSEIVKRGEYIAKNKGYTIHNASKSSRGQI